MNNNNTEAKQKAIDSYLREYDRYQIWSFNGDMEKMKENLKRIIERNIDSADVKLLFVLLKALDIEYVEDEEDRIERNMILKSAIRALLAVDEDGFDKENNTLSKRLLSNCRRWDNDDDDEEYYEEDEQAYHMRSFAYKHFLNDEIDARRYKDGAYSLGIFEEQKERNRLTSRMEKGKATESDLFYLYFDGVIDKERLYTELEKLNHRRGCEKDEDYWKRVQLLCSIKDDKISNG